MIIDDRVVSLMYVRLVLKLHPVLHRPEVITKVNKPRRLNARQHYILS